MLKLYKIKFQGCASFTGDLIIPNSVTKIGYASFENCTGLNRSLKIGNGIETIEAYAFNNCKSITAIKIDKPENSISGASWGWPGNVSWQ